MTKQAPLETPPAFKIAAQPIGKRDWLAQNERSPEQLVAKHRLIEARLSDVWCDNGQCHDAQIEVLETIGAALDLPIDKTSLGPPLLQAAKWVQDDLVIMQKTDRGWVLSAAAVCFPSSWSLQEKFNKPLDQVHAHVPNFGPESRNAAIITRMFDHLPPDQPMMRGNWGLLPDDELFHPTPHHMPPTFEDYGALTFRHEQQTLLKLPHSGCILFTARITLWPLIKIKSDPELRLSFEKQIEAMTLDEIQYKAIAQHKESLLAWLNQT